MSFTLYKLYKIDELRKLSFNFSINDDLDNKYLLREDEENEVTELLRKFNMYEQIRFVDGIAYNISVKGITDFEGPVYNISSAVNEEELGTLEFDEITDKHAFIENEVYDLEIIDIPRNNELTNFEVIRFVSGGILENLI